MIKFIYKYSKRWVSQKNQIKKQFARKLLNAILISFCLAVDGFALHTIIKLKMFFFEYLVSQYLVFIAESSLYINFAKAAVVWCFSWVQKQTYLRRFYFFWANLVPFSRSVMVIIIKQRSVS